MEQTPQHQIRTGRFLNVLSIVLVVLVILGLGRLNARLENLSAKVDAQTAARYPEPLQSATLTSGQGAFSMVAPAEWGPLVKVTNGDLFVLSGQKQPTLDSRTAAKIVETQGYGSDSAVVFMASLSDAGTGDTPFGASTEFTIGKADDALTGKKYSYAYPADTLVGIGYTRHQNDRQYQYSFVTKSGKHLDVVYNVYGSDPRNLVDTVDTIVQSIVVK